MTILASLSRAAARVFDWPALHVRPLAPSERTLLPPAMAAAIDLDAVRIVRRFHNPIAACFNQSVVRGARIFWAKAPDEAATPAERAHLVHELVHVWQYRHLKLTGPEILLHRRYQYELKSGVGFADFGYEQQAAIVEDAFRMKAGLAPRWGKSQHHEDYERVIASCVDCRPVRRLDA